MAQLERDAEAAAGGARCNRCGATDVFWLTVLSKDEAQFLAESTEGRSLALAKPQLCNDTGGRHVCPIDDSDFDVVPDDEE